MQLILRQSSESVQSVQDTVGMGQTESQAGRSKLILKTAKQNKPEKNAHKEFDVGCLSIVQMFWSIWTIIHADWNATVIELNTKAQVKAEEREFGFFGVTKAKQEGLKDKTRVFYKAQKVARTFGQIQLEGHEEEFNQVTMKTPHSKN